MLRVGQKRNKKYLMHRINKNPILRRESRRRYALLLLLEI